MASAAGFEPAFPGSKPSVLTAERHAEWCGRRDSNPDTHGLNVLDMPVLLRPQTGGSGRTRTSVVPKDNASTARRDCRSATLPHLVRAVGVEPTNTWPSTRPICQFSTRANWWAWMDSNHHPRGLSSLLCLFATGPVVGRRARIRTEKTEGLSFGCLPLHHAPKNLAEGGRVELPNP